MRQQQEQKQDEPVILKFPKIDRESLEFWAGVETGLVLARANQFDRDVLDAMLQEAKKKLGRER